MSQSSWNDETVATVKKLTLLKVIIIDISSYIYTLTIPVD